MVVPIIVLRSDIFNKLNAHDNDLNKLDDAILRIDWTGKIDCKNYSLRKLIHKRIEASVGKKQDYDCWSYISNLEDSMSLDVDDAEGKERLWWYMIQRTMDRPRDILKYLKKCSEFNPNGILDKETVVGYKSAEKDYSSWFYDEIGSEIYSHLPIWVEVLNVIKGSGFNTFTPGVLERALREKRAIKDWMEKKNWDEEQICEVLFNFCIIGNMKNQRVRNSGGSWIYRTHDDAITWNSTLDTIVHRGLLQRLGIQRYYNA